MPTSIFAQRGTDVEVDAAGALTGNGTAADPLAVEVDGVTIEINGSNELAMTGALPSDSTITVNGIGTTNTDGLVIQNTTDAAAGAQQFSPRVRLRGEGWKTNATAASQTVDATLEVQPVQGAAAPSFDLVAQKSINGAAATDLVRLHSTASLTAGFSAGGSYTPGYANTTLGSSAGAALDTNLSDGAWANTLIGSRAGTGITKGLNNTAVGENSLTAVTTTTQNTAMGAGAGQNHTGSSSVFIGYKAGNLMTGSSNVFVGALAASVTGGAGASNTAVGESALKALTSGDINTAFGQEAGVAITSGSNHTAIGRRSLKSMVSGARCVALGHFAGAYETGSDAFYVDNQDRTNTAGDKASALLYGTFNATPASQTLFSNSQFGAFSVRGAAVAYADRPATPVEGMLVTITDSSTATWGATIAGGGANRVLAYYNGTNWTVAAI